METIDKIFIFIEFTLMAKKVVGATLNILELAKEMKYSGKTPIANMRKFLKGKGLIKYLIEEERIIIDERELINRISKAIEIEFPEERERFGFNDFESTKKYVEDSKEKKRKKKIIEETIKNYLENKKI